MVNFTAGDPFLPKHHLTAAVVISGVLRGI